MYTKVTSSNLYVKSGDAADRYHYPKINLQASRHDHAESISGYSEMIPELIFVNNLNRFIKESCLILSQIFSLF